MYEGLSVSTVVADGAVNKSPPMIAAIADATESLATVIARIADAAE
jgi:hypothetical protein